MADLCTTADVIARVPSLANHPALAALVTSASAAVENHCRRTFGYSASVVEFHNGDGWGRVWLSRLPVASITAIELSGSALDVASFGFNPETGELIWATGSTDYRHATPFPRGRRNVKVTYAGGYASIPGPVVEAVVQTVKQLADAAKVSGVYSSERIGDYQYTLAAGTIYSLPSLAVQLLAPYVLDITF